MKNTNQILKGAGVLLIAVVMILSTVTVAANTIKTSPVLAGRDTILDEGFEDGVMPPSGGWYTDELNLVTPWTIVDAVTYPDYVHTGDYAGWINYDTPNPSDNWLISPDLDLTGYDAVTLVFWAQSTTDWPTATMELHIRGDGIDDILWDMILDEVWPTDFIYREMTFDLSSYIDQVINISWRYVGIDGNSFGLDDITVTTGGGQPEVPDLDCDGSLSWTDVEPGANVTGTFTVENIGDPLSLLDWEIESYPDWGTFTFDPDGGLDLTPEAGAVTVTVDVVAPGDPETNFTGEIVLVNSEDPDDICVIDVALATPVSLSLRSQTVSLKKQSNGASPLNRNILWDNGPDTGFAHSSQRDLAYPFISQMADDFIFEEDTIIEDVHWWGGFWNGPPDEVDPLDFEIYFYADDGTGNAPTGGGMPDPSPTALAAYTFAGVTGLPLSGNGNYEYEVDLPDPFVAIAGEKYWLAIVAVFNSMPQWGWISTDVVLLSPSVQGFPLLGTDFWTDQPEDMAFYLTGEGGQPAIPDLDCDGSLSWTEVTPEENVTGTFTVENIGDPLSLLDWEIESYPDWGTWTFDPDGGLDLTPEAGAVTVTVEVVAPEDPETEFEGEIVLVNSEDPDDTCIIDVSLATPVSQQSLILQFLEMLAQRFPIIAQILAAIF